MGMDEQRNQFEKTIASRFGFTNPGTFRRDKDDTYASHTIQMMWLTWQAAHAPNVEWQDDDKNYGTAVLEMFGGSFHLEAFRVMDNEPDYVLAAEEHRGRVDAVMLKFSDDEFSTVQIGEGQYVVIIVPFDR